MHLHTLSLLIEWHWIDMAVVGLSVIELRCIPISPILISRPLFRPPLTGALGCDSLNHIDLLEGLLQLSILWWIQLGWRLSATDDLSFLWVILAFLLPMSYQDRLAQKLWCILTDGWLVVPLLKLWGHRRVWYAFYGGASWDYWVAHFQGAVPTIANVHGLRFTVLKVELVAWVLW